MSTNAMAFLLLHKFRNGANIEELTVALDELRKDLSQKHKDVGFTGDSLDIISYSVRIFLKSLSECFNFFFNR